MRFQSISIILAKKSRKILFSPNLLERHTLDTDGLPWRTVRKKRPRGGDNMPRFCKLYDFVRSYGDVICDLIVKLYSIL